MTNKAKQRRRRVAEEHGVSTRTAANIIKARTAARREGSDLYQRAIEIGSGIRRPTPIDERRLRDGARALAAGTDLAVLTDVDLEKLREQLFAGAVALQSLDDLGSPEANAAAMRDYTEIDRRLSNVDRERERRRG